MRRQAMILGAAAALLAAGVPVANVAGNAAQASAQTQQNAPTPKAMANTGGAAATRRLNYLSGDGGGYGCEKPVYRKRPLLSTAQIKRNAIKRRNKLRAKGKR